MMLEIMNLRHGAVVNRNSGKESPDALEMMVEGVSDSTAPVRVNGTVATKTGRRFSAPVKLNAKFNVITVSTSNEFGDFTQTLKVVWDKQSFKRYNFFIDDNSFVFTDIAKERPKSLFDHFYLKFLKQMHDRYGMKVTLNSFYRNDHHPFELKDFPDTYCSEWLDNADWLKLSFHAYSEFPDRPYQNATPVKLAQDFDLLKQEIIRFAGEKTFINPIVLHWAMAQPEAFKVLTERGVQVLSGQFINAQTYVGEPERDGQVCDIGYFRNLNDAMYLDQHQLLYDFKHDMLFIHGNCCCNLLTPEQVAAKLDGVFNHPIYRETINLATHEQYSYPDYFNYLPDHFERIEVALRKITEQGYLPVFFAEGFLGNPSW